MRNLTYLYIYSRLIGDQPIQLNRSPYTYHTITNHSIFKCRKAVSTPDRSAARGRGE